MRSSRLVEAGPNPPLMATHPSAGRCPIPFKDVEIKEKDDHSTPRRVSDYHVDDLISALPVIKAPAAPLLLRNYQGFWFPERVLPGVIAIQRGFKSRTDDVFLCTYPKSGTTWTKALTFATMTRAQYPLLAHHPLLTLNPHDCVARIEDRFAWSQANKIEALPSPRILSTHIPFSLLPDSITRLGCRIIYVCRDPKDALVSGFYFIKNRAPEAAEPLQFSSYFETFCEGKDPFGPIWDHALGYWQESLRRPEEVLFLKYDEMLKEPAANVKRLAEFVGCPFSAEEEEGGVVEEIIRLCSFEKLSSLEVNQSTVHRGMGFNVANAAFFRKGVSGDWRNHMSPEMAKRFDGIVLQKLKGSGLALQGVGLEHS